MTVCNATKEHAISSIRLERTLQWCITYSKLILAVNPQNRTRPGLYGKLVSQRLISEGRRCTQLICCNGLSTRRYCPDSWADSNFWRHSYSSNKKDQLDSLTNVYRCLSTTERIGENVIAVMNDVSESQKVRNKEPCMKLRSNIRFETPSEPGNNKHQPLPWHVSIIYNPFENLIDCIFFNWGCDSRSAHLERCETLQFLRPWD